MESSGLRREIRLLPNSQTARLPHRAQAGGAFVASCRPRPPWSGLSPVRQLPEPVCARGCAGPSRPNALAAAQLSSDPDPAVLSAQRQLPCCKMSRSGPASPGPGEGDTSETGEATGARPALVYRHVLAITLGSAANLSCQALRRFPLKGKIQSYLLSNDYAPDAFTTTASPIPSQL